MRLSRNDRKLMMTVPGTKSPIPHLEQPVTSSQSHNSRVSFLEEQTVQTASTLFQAQPQYTFESWEGMALIRPIMSGLVVSLQSRAIVLIPSAQIVSNSKSLCLDRRSYSRRALRKQSPKVGAKSASARIYASCEPEVGDRSSCSLQILSAKKKSATFRSLVRNSLSSANHQAHD